MIHDIMQAFNAIEVGMQSKPIIYWTTALHNPPPLSFYKAWITVIFELRNYTATILTDTAVLLIEIVRTEYV